MIKCCTNVSLRLCIVLLGVMILTFPLKAEEIAKIELDDASLLGTVITADSSIKVEGKGSIKIYTQWPTLICLGEISNLDLENTRLIYQARVKSQDLEGSAFLEMWCHVGGGQYFSRGINSIVEKTTDWKTIETPFMLKKGEKATKVTLNIVINGKGTVWVDNIRLLKKPLE